LKQVANPIKFSATKQEYRSLGCLAGTHTREALLENGYTEKQISDYEKEGFLIDFFIQSLMKSFNYIKKGG